MNIKFQQILDRYRELGEKLSDPSLASNPAELAKISQEKADIEEIGRAHV